MAETSDHPTTGDAGSAGPATALEAHRQQMAPELQQLRGEEIRSLIVGRTLTHDVSRALREGLSAVTSPYRETFRTGGTVSVIIHGAGTAGQYEIVDDQLCIRLDNGIDECRHLFRSRDGALIQTDASRPEQITPIIVE